MRTWLVLDVLEHKSTGSHSDELPDNFLLLSHMLSVSVYRVHIGTMRLQALAAIVLLLRSKSHVDPVSPGPPTGANRPNQLFPVSIRP